MLDEAIVKGCKKADHGHKHVLDLLVYMTGGGSCRPVDKLTTSKLDLAMLA